MIIKLKSYRLLLTALCIGIILLSCAKPYIAVAPQGFAVYPTRSAFHAISPEGVTYRVRHVRNKPFADMEFWHEALKKRMVDAGYRLLQDTIYESNTNKHVSLNLAAPVGINDYIYLIDISASNRKIIIVEAAGEAILFEKSKTAILEAVQKLKLKDR